MVKFCKCGSDMFICQHCGNDLCSNGCNTGIVANVSASEYVEDKGNVCRKCLSTYYLKNKEGKYIRVEQWKPSYISLKGNPAYDLMM